jgi:leader peptidase (prepilin peptidase) / N-methyltransferase
MAVQVAVGCAVLGLLVGSFLNVVIWRVPRKESLQTPRSHCPHCDHELSPRELIPVVSWLLARGRCRHCEDRIGARYPLVELGTAVLFVAVALRFEGTWQIPAYCLLFAALLSISVIDLQHYIVPNRIVYPVGIASVPALALAAAIDDMWDRAPRSLAGAAIAFVFLYTLHIIQPRGMGFGDVRLSVILGLYLGWLGWGQLVLGLFSSFVFGALVGIALMASGKRGRKQHIPFAPFLAAGTITAVLWGVPILDWYSG